MISIALLLFTTSLLMLLRWWIQKRLQGILLLLGMSRRISIGMYSFIFLPGVVIHEVSHFLVAALLAVPTGEVSIFPKADQLQNQEVTLGSVKIAKSDPIRSSIIGFAPFISGCTILFLIYNLTFPELSQQDSFTQAIGWIIGHSVIFTLPLTWFWLYMLLAVSNTMFMSKSDMKAWPMLIFILSIVAGVVTISGKMNWFILKLAPIVIRLANTLTSSFLFAVFIDLVVVIILYSLEKLLELVTKRRIIYGNLK